MHCFPVCWADTIVPASSGGDSSTGLSSMCSYQYKLCLWATGRDKLVDNRKWERRGKKEREDWRKDFVSCCLGLPHSQASTDWATWTVQSFPQLRPSNISEHQLCTNYIHCVMAVILLMAFFRVKLSHIWIIKLERGHYNVTCLNWSQLFISLPNYFWDRTPPV